MSESFSNDRVIFSTKHLAFLAVFSLALRWYLICAGGQFFSPDENRYYRGIVVLHTFFNETWQEGLRELLTYEDHALISFMALPSALIQGLLDRYLDIPVSETMWVGAGFWSIFSVWNIFLIRRLVLCWGGKAYEADWAFLLAAGSTPLLLYVRHCLPYDIALTWLLLGLNVIGPLHGNRPELARSVASASLAWVGFTTYMGFWSLAGWSLVLIGLWALPNWRAVILRWLVAGIAFVGLHGLRLGLRVVTNAQDFTGWKVWHGDFDEGWTLPIEYFWHTDHLLFALMLLAVAGALLGLGSKGPRIRDAGFLGAVSVVALYIMLVALSVGMHKFVVYGRTCHVLVPFLCIAGGCLIGRTLHLIRSPRSWFRSVSVVVILLVCMAGYNFHPLIKMKFPWDVFTDTIRKYPQPQVMLSVTGPELHVEEQFLRPSRYVFINHRILWPITGLNELPQGKEIFRIPHPFQYKGNQYDMHNIKERALLRNHDASIRLIDRGAKFDRKD